MWYNNRMKPDDHESPKNPGGQGGSRREVTPAAYIKAARSFLRDGKQKAAYSVLLEARVHYPDEPLILSYAGCLQAIVDRKYRSGVDACRRALSLFKSSDPYTASVVYPILYLNLGRAYLAAGKKKDAIDAFQKGQRYDRSHLEIKKELQLLGVRKQPPLSFLSRSNPINKYIGLLLHKSGRGGKTAVR